MKKLKEWVFVGYGIQTDAEENEIVYAIAQQRGAESLADMETRAKTMAYEAFERRKEHESP